jgi:hypothetical protein
VAIKSMAGALIFPHKKCSLICSLVDFKFVLTVKKFMSEIFQKIIRIIFATKSSKMNHFMDKA